MRVCTLASGSSGNSLYIETESTKVLIDAGISMKQIKLRLETIGVELSDIDAVITTHEHSRSTHGALTTERKGREGKGNLSVQSNSY